MFGLTGNYTYYINQGSTDMRCGIDKLSYIVRMKMRKDPCSGDVFIFMSKSRKVVKILRAEGNAFVLYEKRLTKERYREEAYALSMKAFGKIRGLDLTPYPLPCAG